MNRTVLIAIVAAGAAFLSACGIASRGDNGSLHHDLTGASEGYPAGQPSDPDSPALGSSTESKYSRDQAEKAEEKK